MTPDAVTLGELREASQAECRRFDSGHPLSRPYRPRPSSRGDNPAGPAILGRAGLTEGRRSNDPSGSNRPPSTGNRLPATPEGGRLRPPDGFGPTLADAEIFADAMLELALELGEAWPMLTAAERLRVAALVLLGDRRRADYHIRRAIAGRWLG
jgi:hypothetical protein